MFHYVSEWLMSSDEINNMFAWQGKKKKIASYEPDIL